jgi:hypothetical protein
MVMVAVLKMVLLLLSVIEMGWGRLLAGQIMNWVGDGDGSCVKDGIAVGIFDTDGMG